MGLRSFLSRFGRTTTAPSGELTVPPGHFVRTYKATGVPGVGWCPGGVLLASLGTSSDEFREEMKLTAEAVDRALSAQANREVLLTTEARALSELFAPNDVKVQRLAGLLLWVLDSGSVPLWLSDPEPLLAALRSAARHGIPQLLLVHLVPSLSASVESVLAGVAPKLELPGGVRALQQVLCGVVPVATVPQDDHTFLVEVTRPEAVICSLRSGPIPADEGSNAPLQVVRAPRLRRLILEASQEDGRRRLFEELLSREISLLVVADRQCRSAAMSWSVGDAIPAYPDVASVVQAMADLKFSEDRYSWGRWKPRELFEWVHRETTVGLALNAYKEPSAPTYLYLPREAVAELAAGRVPMSDEASLGIPRTEEGRR